MDLARLRDLLRPHIGALSDHASASQFPALCAKLSMSYVDEGRSKRERMLASFDGVPDDEVPEVAQRFLDQFPPLSTVGNSLQDVLWADARTPAIPEEVPARPRTSARPIVFIRGFQTGDMYHVRALMALFKDVTAYVVRTGKSNDKTDEIVSYCRAGGGTVTVNSALPPAWQQSKAPPKVEEAAAHLAEHGGRIAEDSVLNPTRATHFISAKMQLAAERRKNVAALCDGMTDCADHVEAILDDLQREGRLPAPGSRPLVLVNYREAGHKACGVHPALDTCTMGMAQLLKAAATRFPNATVVPIGEYVPTDWPKGPMLQNYWTWPSVNGRGRACEAEVLRCLLKYNVRVVIGMRSGALDLFAFLGFKVVSIDREGERGEGRVRATQDGLGERWFRVVAMKEEREGERRNEPGISVPEWQGKIGDADLERIMDAAGTLYALPNPKLNCF